MSINFELVFSKSELHRETYRFILLDKKLCLDEYREQKKETNRKKNWTTVKIYSRLKMYRREYFTEQWINDLADVPQQDNLKRYALTQLMNEIEIDF